ncbi:hypothetical protein CQW23_24122 [Capsicum baccatum]|uniref:Uncharacterized protein n=1 Tax=Capsicum baccatum TaxID=33114 RepID=A0A2G2VTY7_CAPBA|nr:hypothetical protein CQW23_24122 [Capsicum baccatum]
MDPAVIIWYIWKERDQCCFDGISTPVHLLKARVLMDMFCLEQTVLLEGECDAEYASVNVSCPNFIKENSFFRNAALVTYDVCEKEEDNEKSSSRPPKERPTRLNRVTTRNRSHSSSPATNHKRYSRIGRYLKDTGNAMSYKSLNELEFEEVKGFMDLGFIFRRGHISKNLVSVLPGLQKLEIVMSKDEDKICEDSEAMHIDGIVAEVEEDDKREIVRPYLSEAWLIKRPDSPLLNMKIPRISAASDMKKHLRYWAKTVANVVLQES